MGAIGTRLSPRPLNEGGETNRPNLARNLRRDREAVCTAAGWKLNPKSQPASSSPAKAG